MKSLLTFIVFIFSLNCSAIISKKDSTSKNFEFGARSGFYFTNHFYYFNYGAYLTCATGIQEFSIGPSFAKKPINYGIYGYSINDESTYRLNGLDITYRVFSNGHGKVFDFYFQIDLFQKWNRGLDDYQPLSNYPNEGDSYIESVFIKSNATQLFLEYGFDIKFLKYFYVGTSLGIGGKYEVLTFDYSNYKELSRKFKLFEMDFIFRANFGFRF